MRNIPIARSGSSQLSGGGSILDVRQCASLSVDEVARQTERSTSRLDLLQIVGIHDDDHQSLMREFGEPFGRRNETSGTGNKSPLFAAAGG